MKITRLQLALAATVLLVFAILMISMQEFIRTNIVLPITYLLWVGNTVLDAIPQVVCLSFLVLVGFGVAIAALSRYQGELHFEPRRLARYADPSRYQFWLRRCHHLETSAFFSENFSFELRRLLLGVLAEQEHLSSWEIERQIMDGTLAVPDEVREFIRQRGLAAKPVLGDNGPLEWLMDGWARLLARFSRNQKKEKTASQIQIEAIVHFIETRLLGGEL